MATLPCQPSSKEPSNTYTALDKGNHFPDALDQKSKNSIRWQHLQDLSFWTFASAQCSGEYYFLLISVLDYTGLVKNKPQIKAFYVFLFKSQVQTKCSEWYMKTSLRKLNLCRIPRIKCTIVCSHKLTHDLQWYNILNMEAKHLTY